MSNAVIAQNNIESIAKKLVEKCRKQEFESVEKELYAEDVRSIESHEKGTQPMETKGLKAVMKKGKQWLDAMEIHKIEVSEPLVTDSHFAVKFSLDATDKESNERCKMSEIGVYEVKDGKIVCEKFYYSEN